MKSAAAIRQARARARKRRELCVYRVEVPARTVETLINIGWLTDDQSQDKTRVAKALSDALSLWSQGVA